MYNTPTTVHLELTEKCNASCLQCDRNKNGGEVNQYLSNHEHTLEDIKKIFPVDYLKTLKRIYMCGNYGDPIAATDTLEICQYFKESNPNIKLGMNTNASLKSMEWWTRLAKTGIVVRFSIDGLEDTNHLYRQGTDFNKIMENVKAFIDAGGYAIWDYLIFGHNEHQVQEAEELSIKMGFKQFIKKKTGRFFSNIKTAGKETHQGTNKKGLKTQTLEKPKSEEYQNKALQKEKLLIEQYGSLDNYLSQTCITCKTNANKEVYVSAEGLALPCCWLAGQLYKWYWKPKQAPIWNFIKSKDDISIHHHTIDEIIKGETFTTITNSWTNKDRLKVCALKCGKEFDPFIEQF